MKWTQVGLLLLTGCSFLLREPSLDPDEVMARLKATVRYVRDFEAEAEVSGGGTGWLRAHVWASRPGKVRIEISDPLRIRVFNIWVRGGLVTLWTEKGKVDLKWPLPPLNLVALVCGLPDVEEGELLSFRSEKEGCELTVRKRGTVHRMSLGRRYLLIREEYRDEGGGLLGKRILDEYVKIGRVSLPRRMSFFWDGRKVEVRFLWQKVNQGLSDEIFEPEVG